MKKLIEALHVIQDECNKHERECDVCPLFCEDARVCAVTDVEPDLWKINDEVQKALL